MNIELTPGERILRRELHERYGGRRQGGISPSRVADIVILVTSPTGAQYGYIYDGRSEDGFFHFTGEGQIGDQQMVQGNRKVRDHENEDDRELHLFEAHGRELVYIGEFRYHDHYAADAKDVNGRDRAVIVFRLEQLSGSDAGPRRTRLDRMGADQFKEVPVEQGLTETTLVEPGTEPYEIERREQRLVRSLAERLEAQGHEVSRLQLLPEGEPAPIFCDVYDKTTNTIYEGKGTVTRSAMRMAIGQLADYSRLVSPTPKRVVLMPEEPRPDLLRLAESQGIAVTWPNGDGFDTHGEQLGKTS